MGMLVGLLGGAIAAAFKALQGRRPNAPAPVAPAPWTPMPDAEPVVVPAKPTPTPAAPTTPAPAPNPPAPKPPVERASVPIADLQEAPTPAAPKPAAPAPAKKSAAPRKKKLPPWVEPVDGECPPTHPVKAKLASKIYHLPGGLNYARTRPDRCYVDAAAAEADGLRPAKR